MSRTDDLRGKGATERTGGGGGGAPFVKWGEGYAWVEGRVMDVWEGKYGPSATLLVTGASTGLQAKGKDEDGAPYATTVRARAEVNVGLNYSALQDAITNEDRGRIFHVAFEGWQQAKDGGNRYRVFAVLELEGESQGPVDPKRPPMRGEADRRPMTQAAAIGGGPGAPGEEGPPVEDYEDDPYA